MKGLNLSLKKTLLTGIAILAPLYLTFIIIKFIFNIIATPLSPVVLLFFKSISITIPASEPFISIVSFLLTLLLIYFVGLLGRPLITRRLIERIEQIFFSIPLVKPIYRTLKEMINLFTASGEESYKRVVSVNFPNEKVQIIGFVTGTVILNGERYYSVFIPTTPNPTSGFLIYSKATDVKELDITVEDAMKLIVSAGITKRIREESRDVM